MITRYYFALTNLCNRACELCSCHSDPSRGTHLSFDKFKEILAGDHDYEAQLEGGEPTIHPEFWNMVSYVANDPRCKKIILCINAVKIPISKLVRTDYAKSEELVKKWFIPFQSKPFVLKPSVNSHLINHSTVHMEKMVIIRDAFLNIKWLEGSQLIYNVRRIPKPMTEDGEQWIVDDLKKLGLYDFCNDFEYQRYGKGKDEEDLALPFIVANPVKFHLISPDGKDFETDLIARADYMENMQ